MLNRLKGSFAFRKYVRRYFGGNVAILAVSFVMATPAYAVDTYFNWGDGSIMGLLITIVNWMAIGVTIAVIGGIIYGAIMYTSSGGNPEQSKKAMDIIRNAVIALVLYFAMFAIMNFLIPGGLFT